MPQSLSTRSVGEFALPAHHDELEIAQQAERHRHRGDQDAGAKACNGVVRHAEQQIDDDRAASQRGQRRIEKARL